MSKNKISWVRRKLIDLIGCLYPNEPKLKYDIPEKQLSEIIPIVMDSKWKNFPKKWGQDSLSDFIDQFYMNNIIGTFDNHDLSLQYECLQIVWGCFTSIDGRIKDPKSRAAMNLFLRAASTYSSSCITSMAGQTSETYALLRSCLEYGSYGFYIFMDIPTGLREELWLNRGNGKNEKNKFREVFSHRNLCDSIKEKDGNLARRYEFLYEHTIDLGAHPNEQAVKQGYYEKENEVGLKTGQLFLSANHETIKASLNKTVETGVTVLQMIRIVYPKVFENHGISEKLSEVEKALEKNIS